MSNKVAGANEASLRVEITGVNGGATKTSSPGRVTTYLDDRLYSDSDKISIDAFQGYGDKFLYPTNPYRRREEPIIEIKIGNTYWEGTAKELEKLLK